jgi:serine/threonine-protein kinase HipA
MRRAFWLIHNDLPREGPGSDASTRAALALLPELGPGARVLDVGCGPGRQSLVLARNLQTRVTAVDLHSPYLQRLFEEAKMTGLADRIQPLCAAMEALPFPPDSLDLIWAEGSAYCIGVVNALRLWRPLLRGQGLVAFTEVSWLTPDPPPEALSYWQPLYPDIASEAVNAARAAAAGYDVLGTFRLPAEDWWTEYYTPMERRIEQLRPAASTDIELCAELAEHEQEISMYTRYGSSYGYVFYLLRRSPRP